ncbi:rhodanese-like domain-containing protein [Mycobacteroides salmoniphilum]|uniref:rhodanese-like domain-containing protein n=1 Tax=Mycobacteroides salmoniphilum TaxID=404941 RepID=UPI0009947710|nr:rhodanese-like domain-containing protein [Mycobacteroides salmoniphilum]
MTIHDLLATARGRLRRLPADEVPTALGRGAFLVDIRPAAQRAEEGEVVGHIAEALVIERNVLEWRLDPESDARIPEAGNHDVEWVILCQEGYTSSLAAASLQEIGLYRATDVIGGYKALKDNGILI